MIAPRYLMVGTSLALVVACMALGGCNLGEVTQIATNPTVNADALALIAAGDQSRTDVAKFTADIKAHASVATLVADSTAVAEDGTAVYNDTLALDAAIKAAEPTASNEEIHEGVKYLLAHPEALHRILKA